MFRSPLPPASGENMLVLEDVELEDQGTYVCRAVNSAGSAEERLQVIVEPTNNHQPLHRPGRDYPSEPQQYYQYRESPPPQSGVQSDSRRQPETDGGRALSLTISGDHAVSPGSTARLTCRAQLTLRPQVRLSLINNIL